MMTSSHYTPISGYRSDIDGMRAIAVLAVVIYHYFPRIVPGGFIGVDVFFVISGYLITGILKKEFDARATINLSQFYLRRIRRIFPALGLLLGFTVVAGYYILFPYQLSELGKHLKSAVSFLANFRLYRETGYFDTAAETKPLMQLWSLAVEEQFYIVWPLLFLFAKSLKQIKKIAVLLVVVSFCFCLYKTAENQSFAYLMPYTRFWEIGIGGLAALFEQEISQFSLGRRSRFQTVATGFLSISFAVSCGLLTTNHAFPGAWALIPVLFGLVVVVFGRGNRSIQRLFGSRIFVAVGLISYPLYLWHWTLLVFAKQRFPEEMENAFALLIPLFLSFVLSYLTTKFWEPKFRHESNWTKLTVKLIAPMVVIGCVGFYFYKYDGLPRRFPEEVQFLFKIKRGDPPEWRTKKCFLLDGQSFGDFAPECDEAISKSKPKKILLWGDSHAAHLYPSLKVWADQNNYAVTQFTYSGCPPLLGREIANRKECRTVNENVLNWVRINKPDKILFGLYWSDYQEKYGIDTVSEFVLTARAVDEIKTIQIIIAGQVPIWKRNLPDIILEDYISGGKLLRHSNRGMKQSANKINQRIEAFARANKYSFIDTVKMVCIDALKCTRLTNDNILISVDYGHLDPKLECSLLE